MADDLWSILPVQYRLLKLPIVVLPWEQWDRIHIRLVNLVAHRSRSWLTSKRTPLNTSYPFILILFDESTIIVMVLQKIILVIYQCYSAFMNWAVEVVERSDIWECACKADCLCCTFVNVFAMQIVCVAQYVHTVFVIDASWWPLVARMVHAL
jgi:hypothetical protein